MVMMMMMADDAGSHVDEMRRRVDDGMMRRRRYVRGRRRHGHGLLLLLRRNQTIQNGVSHVPNVVVAISGCKAGTGETLRVSVRFTTVVAERTETAQMGKMGGGMIKFHERFLRNTSRRDGD